MEVAYPQKYGMKQLLTASSYYEGIHELEPREQAK